jgi:AraC-like DNA-binding protein
MLRISLEGTPEHQRVGRFREFFEGLGVRYDPHRLSHDPVEIDLTLKGLPGLQLLSGRMQGATWRRTCQSTDPTEDIGLLVNPRGRLHLCQRGREVTLNHGEATVVSLGNPLDSTHHCPGDLLVLRAPWPLLAPRLASGHDGLLRRVPHGTPALGLLTNYVNIAWQERTLADPNLQRLLVSHLYDLMAVTIGATRDAAEMAQGRGLRAARLHAIKQDIARQLDQPGLSLPALAARHRYTPRFVQRLFAMEGTSFTEYVLRQRLARAHAMLVDPRRDGGKISSVAYDCGFSDVSYFNRAFRRSYDAAPSDIRAQARRALRDSLA